MGGGGRTLLVVRNESLGDRLADSCKRFSTGQHKARGTVDLGGLTTTLDTDANIHVGEALLAEEEDGLEKLEAQHLGLDKVEGDTVDTDHALAGLAVGDGSGGFLSRLMACSRAMGS